MIEEILTFTSEKQSLEGILRYPNTLESQYPIVILIHGSLEQDRNGNLLKTPDNKKLIKKNFFLELSKRLCNAGFATFSWDKRGFGKSLGSGSNYFSEVKDTEAALYAVVNQEKIDKNNITLFGQSAGVYVACMLASSNDLPKQFILSGGLFSDYKDMMKYNYDRVHEYAKKNLEWTEKHDLWGLALSHNLNNIFQSLENGESKYKMKYKKKSWNIDLYKELHSGEMSPKNQFNFINKPALIIHGENDLNVPVEDAYKMYSQLKRQGNKEVELKIISNADHSFQKTPSDKEKRIRERISLTSFKNPYVEEYFESIIQFLNKRAENDSTA